MRRAGCVALLALVVAASGGCGGLPTTHYYMLEPQHVAAAAASTEGLSIGIVPFQVDVPYDQDRIVYRIGNDSTEIAYYAYHRWAAPLSRMLPRIVAGAFGKVTGVSSIEPAAPGRDYDATLRGRVLSIEEVDGPGGARVRISLTLTLVSPDGTALWTDSLTSEETARPADDVAQIVERFQATLNILLAESGTSLARTLAY